jgi:hypothetical protein
MGMKMNDDEDSTISQRWPFQLIRLFEIAARKKNGRHEEWGSYKEKYKNITDLSRQNPHERLASMKLPINSLRTDVPINIVAGGDDGLVGRESMLLCI